MYTHYSSMAPTMAAPSTAVSTQGLVWNGSAWVSSTSSTYSPTSMESSSALIQQYTEYYHGYQALSQHFQEEYNRRTSLAQQQRDELMRYANWYKYYAEQASRAAHFYFSNTNPGAVPPFDVPPPPPPLPTASSPSSSSSFASSSTSSNQNGAFNGNNIRPIQQSTPPPTVVSAPVSKTSPATIVTPATQSTTSSPDGLMNYFHKCLQACKTEEERKEVQGKLEEMIALSLKSGVLHSTNWDALELIRPSTLVIVPQGTDVNKGYISPGSSETSQGEQQKRTFKRSRWEDVNGPPAPSAETNTTPTFMSRVQMGKNEPEPHKGKHENWNVESKTKCVSSLSAPSSACVNNFGPSSFQRSKSLPTNNSYYGPSQPTQRDLESTESDHGSSNNGEDFVELPKVSKKLKTNNGFERSNFALAKRANRFGATKSTSNLAALASSDLVNGTDFDRFMGKGMIGGSNKKLDEADFERMTVKGTCTRLEKEYLRLTAPPRAELVRPEPILARHLTNLSYEWNSGSSTRRDYEWFCSQLKAIRQDCRVQRIQNAFTVKVYETHARIALESDDLNEFNQCQTQLVELYELLACLSLSSFGEKCEQHEVEGLQHRNEFLAYRFIYYVFLTGNQKASSSSSDLMALMLSLTPEQRTDPAIQHALKVREAVTFMDYHAFFRLYKCCPNLGSYLMDRMVPTIRLNALQRICKVYRPSVEISFVLQELGIDSDNLVDGQAWLQSCGCVVKGELVFTKESVVHESKMQTTSSLI